jgi:cytochrome c oxidase assembly protein subunit 15
MKPDRYHPAVHWLALLTAAATFPLIFMGGLVTSHQAGMSVPDWPNSYGYNMFLFPPSKWVGGILYEHTHRLMATVVGFLSILLTIAAWKWESRRSVRWLATATLGMVIVQGVLGGLRVILVQLNLAIVHACVAQAFFCLTTLVAVVTSKWWLRTPPASEKDIAAGQRLVKISMIAIAVIYSQLVIGAVMRHEKAGLAVADFPLIYGKLLPPTSSQELVTINVHRATVDGWNSDPQLNIPVTLWQIWIHALHRYGAVCVTIAVLILVGKAVRRPPLRWLALTLIVLLATQITLGALVVILRKPADLTSAHVAVGALTLMTAFVLTVRSWRLYMPRHESQPQHGFDVMPAGARMAID